MLGVKNQIIMFTWIEWGSFLHGRNNQTGSRPCTLIQLTKWEEMCHKTEQVMKIVVAPIQKLLSQNKTGDRCYPDPEITIYSLVLYAEDMITVVIS